MDHDKDPPEENDVSHAPPLKLDYGRARYADSQPHGPGTVPEFAAGFFSYFGMLALIYFGLFSGGFVIQIAALLVAGLIFLGMYLQTFRGWRSFLPGVLLGLGLSCIIGVGGIFWLCGGGFHY